MIGVPFVNRRHTKGVTLLSKMIYIRIRGCTLGRSPKTKTLGELKVMLHGTVRNDDIHGNTTLQCWNNVVIIRNNVATMLQRCVVLKLVVANRLV